MTAISPPAEPVPGQRLGADLGAATRWAVDAFARNLAVFLVPALVYGVVYGALTILSLVLDTAGPAGTAHESMHAGGWALSILLSLSGAAVFVLWWGGAYRAAGIIRDGGRPGLGAGLLGNGRLLLVLLLPYVLLIAFPFVVGSLVALLPGVVVLVLSVYAPAAASSGRGVLASFAESFSLAVRRPGRTAMLLLLCLSIGMVAVVLLPAVVLMVPAVALLVTGFHHRLSGRALTEPARS